MRTLLLFVVLALRSGPTVQCEEQRELLGPDYVRFTEDAPLQLPEAAGGAYAKRQWSDEVLKRGFAVAARPTLPLTHHTYVPTHEELDVGCPRFLVHLQCEG